MDRSGGGPEADMTIAVMGMTGVGKSTFIRHCLDASSKTGPIIGHDIESCTQDVEVYQCRYGVDRQYTIDMVDTPGFDDTHRSDREVLEAISLWLTTSGRYQDNRKLHGIICLHRISDVRMQGSALNNLRMFKKLCGTDAFHRILLTTTMWEQVLPEDGSRRLAQLETMDDFWAPMIRKGSRVVRHHNTTDSAQNIMGLFLNAVDSPLDQKPPTSVMLEIQTELSHEGATLMQTGAGRELDVNLAAAQIKAQSEVDTINADIRDAEAEGDDADAEYLRKQIPTLMRKIEELQADREGLHVSFKEIMESERRRQDKASEMQKALIEERDRSAALSRDADDLRQQHEDEINRLRQQLQDVQVQITQPAKSSSPANFAGMRKGTRSYVGDFAPKFAIYREWFFFPSGCGGPRWSLPFPMAEEQAIELEDGMKRDDSVLHLGQDFVYSNIIHQDLIFALPSSGFEEPGYPRKVELDFLIEKYPDIAKHQRFDSSHEVSFGEDGLVFAVIGRESTSWSICHRLPDSLHRCHDLGAWETNPGLMSTFVPRVWLGAKQSWICQTGTHLADPFIAMIPHTTCAVVI